MNPQKSNLNFWGFMYHGIAKVYKKSKQKVYDEKLLLLLLKGY